MAFDRERKNILDLAMTRCNARISEANQKGWDKARELPKLPVPKKLVDLQKANKLADKADEKYRKQLKKTYDAAMAASKQKEALRDQGLFKQMKAAGFSITQVWKNGTYTDTVVESIEHSDKRKEALRKPFADEVDRLEKLRNETREKLLLCGTPADLRIIFEQMVKAIG
jgi:hypothetical protein